MRLKTFEKPAIAGFFCIRKQPLTHGAFLTSPSGLLLITATSCTNA